MRRVVRWGLWVVGAIALLLVIGLIVIQTGWFKDWLRGQAERRASNAMNGQLSIGRLRGSLFSGVTVDNVTLTQNGQPLAQIDSASIDYDLATLVGGRLAFGRLVLHHPVIHLRQTPAGWNVTQLTKPSAGGGNGTAIAFDELKIVDGDLTVDPLEGETRHIASLNLDGSLSYSPESFEIGVRQLQAQDQTDDITLQQVSAHVTGPVADLDARFDAKTSAGSASGTLDGKVEQGARVLDGRVTFQNLDLGDLLRKASLSSDLTGQAQIHATLPDGQGAPAVGFQVQSPRVALLGYEARDVSATGSYSEGVVQFNGNAHAYGGSATAAGTWRGAGGPKGTEPAGLDISGRFASASLQRLPDTLSVPPLQSDLAGRYHVQYRPGNAASAGAFAPATAAWTADVTLDRSTIEGARLAAGSTGHAESRQGTIRYSADGHIADLNARRLGGPIDLALLQEPRFDSDITGDFHVEGGGSAPATRHLTATASLGPSSIADARVRGMDLDVRLDGQTLQLQVRGPFEHVTNRLAGIAAPAFDVNGVANASLTFGDLKQPVAPANLEGTAQVTLHESSIAGLTVDRLELDASNQDGLLTVRQLNAEGEGVQASASGTAALGDRGRSNLTVKADTNKLEAIGDEIGQPILGRRPSGSDGHRPARSAHRHRHALGPGVRLRRQGRCAHADRRLHGDDAGPESVSTVGRREPHRHVHQGRGIRHPAADGADEVPRQHARPPDDAGRAGTVAHARLARAVPPGSPGDPPAAVRLRSAGRCVAAGRGDSARHSVRARPSRRRRAHAGARRSTHRGVRDDSVHGLGAAGHRRRGATERAAPGGERRPGRRPEPPAAGAAATRRQAQRRRDRDRHVGVAVGHRDVFGDRRPDRTGGVPGAHRPGRAGAAGGACRHRAPAVRREPLLDRRHGSDRRERAGRAGHPGDEHAD